MNFSATKCDWLNKPGRMAEKARSITNNRPIWGMNDEIMCYIRISKNILYMVYVLILQQPLRISVYSSLTGLFEDNGRDVLKASYSKLEKWDWDYNYIADNVVISKREPMTAGDVRRKKEQPK